MSRIVFPLIGLCLLAGRAAAITVPRPVQVCPLIPAEQAPVIDGSLDDPAWERARAMTPFWLRDGSAQAAQQTSARAVCDGTTIYLAIRCADDSIDGIVAERTGQDATAAWTDDSVELFIAPDAAKPEWYHLIITAAGGTYDARGEGNAEDFDMRLDHKVVIGERSWTVEAAIELGSLFLERALQGHVMHFNVCRTRPASGELSSWSPTGLAFANRDRFGDLVIGSYQQQQATLLAGLERSLAAARRVSTQVDPKSWRQVEAETTSLLERVRGPIPDQQWQSLRDAMRDAERRLRRIALRPRGAVLWTPNTWRLPMPEDLPPVDVPEAETVEVWAFANEFESRALALSNFAPQTANVRVILTDFLAIDGKTLLPAWDVVTVRTAPPMRLVSNRRKRDPLPRLQEGDLFKVPTAENEILWLTFRTRGIEPGRYTGGLTVSDLDHTFRKSVSLTLTVYPIPLDDSELPYIHTWARFETLKHVPLPARIRHWQDYYHNVGYVLYYDVPGYDPATQCYDVENLDMTRFDRYLDEAEEWADFYLLNVWWDVMGAFGKPGPERWSEEYNLRLATWVTAIRDRLRDRGIGPDKWAFYAVDEPYDEDGRRELAITFAQAIRRIDPDVLTYTTINKEGDTERLLRLADNVPVIQAAPWVISRDTLNLLKARPKPAQLWCYNVSNKETHYAHFRGAFISQTYPNNYTGNGFWAWTNRRGPSDWDDFDGKPYDYSAIYTERGPIIPSLRAEGFRESVEDFKYLMMLDAAIGQAEQAGADATLIRTAASERDRVLKSMGGPESIPDFRRTVREQIVALGAAAGTLDVEAVRAVEDPGPACLTSNGGIRTRNLHTGGHYTLSVPSSDAALGSLRKGPVWFRGTDAAAEPQRESGRNGALTDGQPLEHNAVVFGYKHEPELAIVFDLQRQHVLERILVHTIHIGAGVVEVKEREDDESWTETGRIGDWRQAPVTPTGAVELGLGNRPGRFVRLRVQHAAEQRYGYVTEVQIIGRNVASE